MVILTVIFGCLLSVSAVIIFVLAMRIEDMRRRTIVQVESAQETVRVLTNLLQNPAPTTPPDKLIESIGATLHKIVSGDMVSQQIQGESAVSVPPDEPETTEHYFPDVEFDEWLGNEGIPPAAGWWSPQQNDEPNENVN